jgi:steroid delta-isomerase-like uncharacterized protein
MANLLSIAQKYFDAWNNRDADALVATFAEGGTYSDPSSGEVSGEALKAYVKNLWEAFPDLSFDLVSAAEAGPGIVAAQWFMKGTNTGPFNGLPPSKRTVALPGADFIKIEGNRIKSVKGYFDSRVVPEQLGLQVVVQPNEAGPFTFGMSVAAHTGKKEKPGAFSITAIWNTNDQTEEVKTLSTDITKDMLGMDGFIGTTLVRIGGVGITVSAWEKPQNTIQLMRGGTHSKAMKRFWEDLGYAAFTSVWVPHRINPFWVRCTACKKMADYEGGNGVCACGETLPERPGYF